MLVTPVHAPPLVRAVQQREPQMGLEAAYRLDLQVQDRPAALPKQEVVRQDRRVLPLLDLPAPAAHARVEPRVQRVRPERAPRVPRERKALKEQALQAVRRAHLLVQAADQVVLLLVQAADQAVLLLVQAADQVVLLPVQAADQAVLLPVPVADRQDPAHLADPLPVPVIKGT